MTAAAWHTLTHQFLVPWAMEAISLFNTVLLLWLGLTVLLNARQRSWGNWLAGLGLLLGGAFFVAHTASFDYDVDALIDNSPSWWLFLSIPLLALPFGWMVLMLWYCGYWDEPANSLQRRTRWCLLLASGCVFNLFVLVLMSSPHLERTALAGYSDFVFLGVRALLFLYPPFLVLCIATALYALANPAPSGRIMREEARRRARPWLFGSTLVQLMVSLGVAGGLVFIAFRSVDFALPNLYGSFERYINIVDLLVETMIGVAVMLLGKAVVSYEIFTEKILPRKGFWRQWRAIVILAAIYASLLAFVMVPPPGIDFKPVYALLLSTCLMSFFLALFSFRAYDEREQAVSDLRPFLASQHLYDGLLSGATDQMESAMDTPFHALCSEVLGASLACLLPRGHLAPLAGGPRLYPPGTPFRAEWNEFAANIATGSAPCVALPPESGMAWLVPLGSRKEQLGVLLLGEKWDGSMYTQEEIEVARAAGEHLLDAQAGATLAGRLMNLQREKLAEIQMLDRRARRVLHDDILPQLHTALLELGAVSASPAAVAALTTAHRGISDLLREMPVASSPLARRSLLEALRYEVEGELAGHFDEVSWDIDPLAEIPLSRLSPLSAETLYFAAREVVRNAGKYGRGGDGERKLGLVITARLRDGLELEISDNGAGVPSGGASAAPVDDEFRRGGHGLVLHGTMLAVVGGQLSLESPPHGGVKVVLHLPEQFPIVPPDTG